MKVQNAIIVSRGELAKLKRSQALLLELWNAAKKVDPDERMDSLNAFRDHLIVAMDRIDAARAEVKV